MPFCCVRRGRGRGAARSWYQDAPGMTKSRCENPGFSVGHGHRRNPGGVRQAHPSQPCEKQNSADSVQCQGPNSRWVGGQLTISALSPGGKKRCGLRGPEFTGLQSDPRKKVGTPANPALPRVPPEGDGGREVAGGRGSRHAPGKPARAAPPP